MKKLDFSPRFPFYFTPVFAIILSMNTAENTLSDQSDNSIENLQAEIENLRTENEDLNQRIASLQEQIAWLQRHAFGKKSERIIAAIGAETSVQLTFPELEAFLSEEKKPEPVKPEGKPRKKPNRNKQDAIKFPANLPIETIVIDLSEEEKICKETGLPLVKIGEEVTLKLAYTPGLTLSRKSSV